MEVALKNTKTTIPVSMLQEIHFPDKEVLDLHVGHDTDILDAFDGGNNTTTLSHVNGDDVDDILIESTIVQTDCIYVGLCALPHKEALNCHHYNAYDMIIPRAKELVSLADASKSPKERGVIVEDTLNKMISTKKANIASENPSCSLPAQSRLKDYAISSTV